MKIYVVLPIMLVCFSAGFLLSSTTHKPMALELRGYQVSRIGTGEQESYSVTFAGNKNGPHLILPITAKNGSLPIIVGVNNDASVEIMVDVAQEKIFGLSLSLTKMKESQTWIYLDGNLDGVFETLIQVDSKTGEKSVFDANVEWRPKK